MNKARQRILDRVKRTKAMDEQPMAYKVHVNVEDALTLFKNQAIAAGFNIIEINKAKDLLPFLEEDKQVVAQSHFEDIEFFKGVEIKARINRFGAADQNTDISLTQAELAVAETGSVLVKSGRSKEYSLHVLVEEEFIFVDKEMVVASLNDCWNMLRKEDNQSRVFCFITGPSKTADVEQTLQIGAHGPRKTTVVLYEFESSQ